MFTVISYRESGTVHRGGYLESLAHSGMEIATAMDKESAIDSLAYMVYENQVETCSTLNPGNYEATQHADYFVGVNGYFGTEHTLDHFSVEEMNQFDEADELRNEILDAALKLGQAKYDARMVEHRRKEREKADIAQKILDDKKEARERAQLAELKAKYEVAP